MARMLIRLRQCPQFGWDERIVRSSVWREWRPTDSGQQPFTYNRSWRLPDCCGRHLDGPLPVPITWMDSGVHLVGGKQSITRRTVPWEQFSCGPLNCGGEIEKDLEKYLQKHHPRSRLIFRDECSRRFHFINKKTSIQVVTRRMNESTRENDILNKFRPTIFHFLSFNLT